MNAKCNFLKIQLNDTKFKLSNQGLASSFYNDHKQFNNLILVVQSSRSAWVKTEESG